MALYPLCHRCNDHVENVLHCLRDCHLSACIWRSLGYNSTASSRSYTLTRGSKKVFVSWTLLFLWRIWYKWKAQNAMYFDNEQASYHQLRHNIGSYLSSLLTSLGRSVLSRPQHWWTSWPPSRMEAMIFNIDGSSFGSLGRYLALWILRIYWHFEQLSCGTTCNHAWFEVVME